MENKKERDLLKLKNYKTSLKNKEKKLLDIYMKELVTKEDYKSRKKKLKIL